MSDEVTVRKLIYAIILLVITCGIFWSVQKAELVWNDHSTTQMAASGGWKPLPLERYEPMAPAVWRGIAQLIPGGVNGAHWSQVVHRASLVVHLGSTLVVFMILALLLRSEAAALMGAALFGLHPLQTEAVAYASAFKIVLGGFFALVAIWQYLVYAQGLQAGPRRAKGRRSYYVATAAFGLAMLSDAAMVVTPALAWLLTQLLPKQTSLYRARIPAWRLGLWAVLAIPSVYWTIRSQDTQTLKELLPLWMKPVVAGNALSFYLYKTLVPIAIGPDYGRSPLVLTSHWWGYITWLIPLALVLIASAARGKERAWYNAPLLTFIAALSPVLGLVYFSAQTTSTVASRYAYVAMLGPALIAAFIVARSRRIWLPLTVCAALVACCVLTRRELQHWQQDDSLWTHALAVNPASPLAHLALGGTAMRQGNWQKAREDYLQVIASNAFSPAVYFNLGDIERQHGDARKATEYYTKALQLKPSMVQIHDRLGATYLTLGDRAAAEVQFAKAVELAPENETSLRLLGMLLVRKQAYGEAIPYLLKSVRLGDEGHATEAERAESHALLGLALRHTNQPGPAEEHLETALKLAPKSREANRALGDIHFSQGQFEPARRHYEQAIAEGDRDFSVYQAMGKIHGANKEYSKAISYFTSALSINPADAHALQDIGVAYFHLRQQKEASNSLKKALAIDPNLAASHFYLGDIARWQGKEADSIHEYQQALKIDPNLAEAHYRLGNYYLKNDQLTLAIQQFQAGLHAVPEDPKLRYGLKRAQKARDAATSEKRG